MRRKFALFVSAVLAAGTLAGCGGQKYTAEDGSFSIVLPSDEWEADNSEFEGVNMYTFTLSATSDSALETGFEDSAVITFAELDEETVNYDTIPVTEEEAEELFADAGYEILSFEGESDENGVKSNLYSLKVPLSEYSGDDEDGYYMIFKTEASETEGYLAGGMIFRNDEELLKEIEESLKSITINKN